MRCQYFRLATALVALLSAISTVGTIAATDGAVKAVVSMSRYWEYQNAELENVTNNRHQAGQAERSRKEAHDALTNALRALK